MASRLLLAALVLASLAVSTVIVAYPDNAYGTLENQYTDHLRHQRYGEEFLRSGLAIYTEPAGSLQRLPGEDDRTYIWPAVSYPYPLGTLLLHLPAGVATYRLGTDPILVNRGLIALYVTLAHLCLYVFARGFFARGEAGNPFLGLWVVGIFWVSMVMWSLNGQFEALPLLLVLLASRSYWRGRYDISVALIGGALLFKYQAALFAPLLISMLWRRAAEHPRALLNWGTAVLGVAVAADLFTSALSYRYVQMPDANLIGYSTLFSGQLFPGAARLLVTLAMTLTLAAYLAWQRQPALATNVLFAAPFLALLPQVQGWYLLWLFPLALFARGAQRDALGFWALGLAYLVRQLPDPSFISALIMPRLPW